MGSPVNGYESEYMRHILRPPTGVCYIELPLHLDFLHDGHLLRAVDEMGGDYGIIRRDQSFLRLPGTVVDLIFIPIDQDSFAFATLAIHSWFIEL